MKKKLLLAGATLLLAAAAVTGFAAYERSNVSDLHDADAEALADLERRRRMLLYVRELAPHTVRRQYGIRGRYTR